MSISKAKRKFVGKKVGGKFPKNDEARHIKSNKCGVRGEFFRTGITGVDGLFKRGIPWGSSVLVEGGPGSGKTLFCLETAMNACKCGFKVLYMSFEEREDSLRSHMHMFGHDPLKYENEGLLMIKRFNALDIARSVEALLSEAKKELLIEVQPVLIPDNFKPDLVLIDSLSSISSAFSGEEYRFRIYMEQLFRYLESHDITSLLIRETAKPTHIGTSYGELGDAVSFLSDGILVIYSVLYSHGERGRALEVFKMRGEEFKRKIVEMVIEDKKGVTVFPDRPINGDYTLT
ncbi:MAG: AAA family ATPase [Candidatus Diapherotrites archaeon]|nr:AAA family ATPase [Candidatus Diapherotrites archaeon]